MNKNIFKVLICFFLLFVGINVKAITLPAYTNEETGYQVIVEDDAELLSDSEASKLMEDMKPITKYGNVMFKSISDNYTSASSYASIYYHEKFGTASGTMFLIDMDNRMIYIFSDGENYKYITSDKGDIITDNVYTYASDQEYYECASIAFEQIYTILEGGKIAEPMRYISNVFIALTVAFFTSFIVVLINTSIKKAGNAEILKTCDISFKMADVNAVKTGQTRRYSPQSDSSSGGGGGGGGGGGSSGGGGGHSF